MKTDYDRVKELFNDLGILDEYNVNTRRKPLIISEGDTERVDGYRSFYSKWEFDTAGNFIKVGFYE
jgi:hypothetical protein